jgi:hypothetical protein
MRACRHNLLDQGKTEAPNPPSNDGVPAQVSAIPAMQRFQRTIVAYRSEKSALI